MTEEPVEVRKVFGNNVVYLELIYANGRRVFKTQGNHETS